MKIKPPKRRRMKKERREKKPFSKIFTTPQ